MTVETNFNLHSKILFKLLLFYDFSLPVCRRVLIVEKSVYIHAHYGNATMSEIELA